LQDDAFAREDDRHMIDAVERFLASRLDQAHFIRDFKALAGCTPATCSRGEAQAGDSKWCRKSRGA
jgi:hypothetical protein